MTKFVISFVLGFRTQEKGLSKKSKNSKQDKSTSVSNIPIKSDKQFIVCGSSSQFIHIDYTIVPKKLSYSLDVIFYENMAIIYANCGQDAQRTIQNGKLSWCCFTITHEINLIDKDLIKLHDVNVIMRVYPIKTRVPEKIRRIRPGTFTLKRKDINTRNLFAPLVKVNMSEIVPLNQEIKKVIWDKFIAQQENPNPKEKSINYLDSRSDLLHIKRAEYLLKRIKKNLELDPFKARTAFGSVKASSSSSANLSVVSSNSLANADNKLPKKSVTNNLVVEVRKDYIDLSFPGEMVFTDRKEILLEFNSKSTTGFVLFTVKNLLTSDQCSGLNPFIISVTSIDQIPVSILKDNGFDHIYVKYETPLFGTIQTNAYPLTQCVNIQESRAFLTHTKDKLALLNFAQSGHILFQIRGLRQRTQTEICGKLFGTQNTDSIINQPFNEEIKTLYADLLENRSNCDINDQLLFVSEYTYKNSLCSGWISASSIPCQNINNLFFCEPNIERLHKRNRLNTVDFHYSNETASVQKEKCFLSTQQLLNYGTVLNLTMSVTSPLSRTLLSVLGTNEPLSRLGIIIYDINIIVDLLTMVYEHNQSLKYYYKLDTIADATECVKRQLNKVQTSQLDKNYIHFVTGFYIDDGGKFYMFIEGPASGFIQVMWHKVMFYTTSIALIWYNSDLIFTERLYSGMLPCSSIYGVVLKEPIESLFQMSYTFLEGSMPIPCWIAIRKLNFLFMESTMVLTSTRGLFPTIEELISFDIEFGIPFKACDSYFTPSSVVLDDLEKSIMTFQTAAAQNSKRLSLKFTMGH